MNKSIDWKKVRADRVLPVEEHDPAIAQIRTQLRWLDKYPAPEGNDFLTGKSYVDIHIELRQSMLDEIECYSWRKSGFSPTQEILDACRDCGVTS